MYDIVLLTMNIQTIHDDERLGTFDIKIGIMYQMLGHTRQNFLIPGLWGKYQQWTLTIVKGWSIQTLFGGQVYIIYQCISIPG